MPSEPVFPRPQMNRSRGWQPLNGPWQFRRDPTDAGLSQRWHEGRDDWPEHIQVPYAWETPASGVQARWLSVGWYRREIAIPDSWRRAYVVFAAVHHHATVWVNGQQVGQHVGGYTPFEVDITDGLVGGRGTLVVRVEAPLDKRFIPHGKQRSEPVDDWDGCSFEPTSGIWQSVWAEDRPTTHLRQLSLRPNDNLTGIEVRAQVSGSTTGCSLQVRLDGTDQAVRVPMTGEAVQLTPTSPRLWSPADPALYSVTATLETPEGSDVVGAYSGLRRIEARDGQLFLNGRRCYLRGVLDQGYWPRTGMTAPNDEALRADVELAAAAGFNLIRKHLKFENPRQLYWADRLGVLAWVEPPSVGRYSEDSMAAFMALLAPMAEIYGNHPSVILWGIFNEEWGLDWSTPQDPQRQRTVAAAYDRLRSADRSRPIIDNSGWAHVRTDVVDWHVYTDDPAYWSEVVSGLAGGRTDTLQIGIAPNRVVPRPLHLDPPVAPLPLLNSEYGVGLTGPERGWHMRWQTQMMRGADRLCGYVYCELYDIEHETAGVFTAARDPKDLGRTNPADVHAETVIVVELVPVAPGADIVIDADETATSVGFPVRISHHGSHALLGHLWWQWEHESLPAGSVELRADPFHCTDPIGITAKLTRQPGDTGAARLMLTVTDLDATMVARTFVDVRPTWVSGQSLIEH